MNFHFMKLDCYSPAAFELLWRRVKLNREQHACDAFYLPDTVLIECSAIKAWYFTSTSGMAVLRKGASQLAPETVIESFSADVFPLDVCCFVSYIDFGKDTDILCKVNYLTPP